MQEGDKSIFFFFFENWVILGFKIFESLSSQLYCLYFISGE